MAKKEKIRYFASVGWFSIFADLRSQTFKHNIAEFLLAIYS